MQPRNPFQGQPTSNMDFPVEAYAQAMANTGAIDGQKMAQMGESIGKALTSLGGVAGNYVNAKADYSATQSMLKSPTYQKLLGLDEKSGPEFSKALAKAQGDGGYAAANKTAESVLKYLFQSNQLAQEMQARANIANAQIQGAYSRAQLNQQDKTQTDSGEEDDINVFMKAIENIRNRRKLGNSQQGNKPQ